MKFKSDTLEQLKEMVAELEATNISCKIRVVRMDNGGENLGNKSME